MSFEYEGCSQRAMPLWMGGLALWPVYSSDSSLYLYCSAFTKPLVR